MKEIVWVGGRIVKRFYSIQSWVYDFHVANGRKHIPGERTNFLKGRRVWLVSAHNTSEETVVVKP